MSRASCLLGSWQVDSVNLVVLIANNYSKLAENVNHNLFLFRYFYA